METKTPTKDLMKNYYNQAEVQLIKAIKLFTS